MDGSEDKRVLELQNRLNFVKSRISDLRKQGYDTKIAELKMMNIPSKIQYFMTTLNKSDYKKAIKRINLVQTELESAKKDEYYSQFELQSRIQSTIPEETEYKDMLTDYQDMPVVKRIFTSIDEAYYFIREGEYREALRKYIEIREVYKFLPRQLKSLVFNKSNDIYKKILNSKVAKSNVEYKMKIKDSLRKRLGFLKIFKLFRKN